MPTTDTAAARPDALVRYAAAADRASAHLLVAAVEVDLAVARARAALAGRLRAADGLGARAGAHARRAAGLAATTGRVGVAFASAGGAAGLRALGRRLQALDDGDVAAFLATVLRLPLVGGLAVAPSVVDPDLVAALVASLAPQQLSRLAASHPHLVGPVDGMPVEARYAANRVIIARTAEAAELLDADQRAADLRALLAPGRQILFVDPRGDGRVAEVFGDLETARNIAVVVPGMGNSLANFASGTVSKGQAILGAAEPGTAVVAWLGYDSPLVDVVLDDEAIEGAEHLVQLVDGLGDGALRTVVGHSYGTVVVAAALQRGLDVDQVVVTGSPGMLEPTAEDLAGDIPVWAARAPFDYVSWTQAYGVDPSDPRFGATRFDTGDEIAGHSGYFDPGTESLANIGRIVSGDADEVTVLEPGLVEGIIRQVDRIHGLADQGIDRSQALVVDAGGLVGWAIDHAQPVLPDALEPLVDGVQRGTGDAFEVLDRATDFVQRLTSPDLVGDVALDSWEYLRDHADDAVRHVTGTLAGGAADLGGSVVDGVADLGGAALDLLPG